MSCEGNALSPELFAVFDAENEPLVGEDGCRLVVPRHDVHRLGLFHRSANCIVVCPVSTPALPGLAVLLQRRAPWKDVAPDCWDLSCAEHLKPGESYDEGIRRGLQEELDLLIDPQTQELSRFAESARLSTPLGVRMQKTLIPERGIQDCEFSQTFLLIVRPPLSTDDLDRMIRLQQEEVSEVRWFSPEWISEQMLQHPSEFAPWFLSVWPLVLPHILSSA